MTAGTDSSAADGPRGKGDAETLAFINRTYERADAFLFGRRTYELFAGSWGTLTERDVPGWESVVRALNTRPKYVASTVTDPAWPGTTVLSGDLATAIADLKAEPGGELQVHGSGALTRWLLEIDLVDEMILVVVPVVLGQGTRLFPEAGPDLALDLVESRVGGELVPLAEQDRGARDGTLIAEGHRLVRERLAAAAGGVAPGRYQVLAAINAVHTCARDMRDTDWSQVLALYDQLVRLDPSPIVALNRAIAVAELDGPQVALGAVDRLEPRLAGYHAYHATRADLLRRLGRSQQSRAAYDKAIELAGNTAETAYLTRRRDQLR